MSSYSLTEGVITTLTCGVCGILICLPKGFEEHRRKDGQLFYCLNGHTLSFNESETERLKRQLHEQLRRNGDLSTAKYNAEKSARRLLRELKKLNAGVATK